MTESPAELLTRAADALIGDFTLPNGNTIGPEAVAEWLRGTAKYMRYEQGAVSSPENGKAFFEKKYGGAIAFAKQVLGEP